MKTVSKILIVLSVVSVIFAASYGDDVRECVASEDFYQYKNRPEPKHKIIFQEINLTKEQEIKIKDILKKYESESDETINIRNTRKELMEELDSNNPSDKKIMELKNKIVDFQSLRLDEMINMKKEINSVFTKEQMFKLNELRKERDSKFYKTREDNKGNGKNKKKFFMFY